jgi:hypothetical protein
MGFLTRTGVRHAQNGDVAGVGGALFDGFKRGPANTVPMARPLPSGLGTLVATRMYSSPPYTNGVAVIA